jgi:uncharacterized membrane protein YkvA (DUF1232 family)
MGTFLKENWLLIIGVIYVISPLDLIPEMFFPVVGYADDAVLVGIELIRRWSKQQKLQNTTPRSTSKSNPTEQLATKNNQGENQQIKTHSNIQKPESSI